MSDKNNNIEELFQEAFEHFEPDVNPGIWNQVQSQINTTPSPAGDGGVSSSGTSVVSGVSSAVVKIAATVGIAGSLVAGGYWLTKDVDEKETPLVNELSQQEKSIVSEELTNETVAGISIETAQTDDSPSSQEENTVDEAVTEVAPVQRNEEVEATILEGHRETLNDQNTEATSKVNEAVEQSEELTNVPDNKAESIEKKEVEQVEEVPVAKEETTIQPKASINASVRRGTIPLSVRFSNWDSSAEYMRWDFGDDSQPSNSTNPYHTFENAGEYLVTLEVKGKDGWVSKDTVEIVVNSKTSMIIPNIFTPNRDGINDAFKVEAENIEKFHCIITDRNGKEVFQMNNINSFWDGRDKFGNEMNKGSYLYIIKFTTTDGMSDVKKGVLMLNK